MPLNKETEPNRSIGSEGVQFHQHQVDDDDDDIGWFHYQGAVI